MFGFVEWDSPLALLGEFAFAVVVFIAILFIVRRIERKAPPADTKREPFDDA